MALSEQSIQGLISALSLTDDQVASLNEADDKAKAVSTFFTTRDDANNAKFLDLKLNDPDFKKPFHDAGFKEAQGKYMNSGRNAMGSFFSLSKDQLYDEDGKGYDLKKILQTGSEKMKLGKPSEDIVKIQEEHAEKVKVWDAEKSSFKSQLEEKDAFHNAFASKQKITGLLKNELRKVEKLKHGIDDATLLFLDRLNGFKIGLTEAGTLEFKAENGTSPEIDGAVITDPAIYVSHLCGKYEWINTEEEKPIVPIIIKGDLGDGAAKPVLNARRQRALDTSKGYDPTKA